MELIKLNLCIPDLFYFAKYCFLLIGPIGHYHGVLHVWWTITHMSGYYYSERWCFCLAGMLRTLRWWKEKWTLQTHLHASQGILSKPPTTSSRNPFCNIGTLSFLRMCTTLPQLRHSSPIRRLYFCCLSHRSYTFPPLCPGSKEGAMSSSFPSAISRPFLFFYTKIA